MFIDDEEPPQPEVVVPVESQPQEETPELPIPEPEVPEEEPPPKSTTTPAQEYVEWKRKTGIYDASLREFQEHTQWKQKMDLYDTSLLDL